VPQIKAVLYRAFIQQRSFYIDCQRHLVFFFIGSSIKQIRTNSFGMKVDNDCSGIL